LQTSTPPIIIAVSFDTNVYAILRMGLLVKNLTYTAARPSGRGYFFELFSRSC
jgi:hypothetical protein